MRYRPMRPMPAAALLLGLLPALALAFDFPQLTGRVVDQAGIMSTEVRSAVAGKLKDLEDKSSIQLVVATVASLQGSDIETYANQLFRTWQLGEKQKNNGVLLLVAPNEHKVRIEVGYGLESTLTARPSSVAPSFHVSKPMTFPAASNAASTASSACSAATPPSGNRSRKASPSILTS